MSGNLEHDLRRELADARSAGQGYRRQWEIQKTRAEAAEAKIAAAWDEGERAGWGRANRKWSDEPDLERASNPYRVQAGEESGGDAGPGGER